jgi:ketosteroid isomerase-like protein
VPEVHTNWPVGQAWIFTLTLKLNDGDDLATFENRNQILIMYTTISKFVRLSLMLTSLCSLTYAQTQDEKEIALALERFRVAMVQPDTAVLAALASDDLEYVHSSGAVRNKGEFINEFTKRWTNFSKVIISNQSIKVTGDNAIVRHRLVADAHNPGYPAVVDIIILMVWRKEGGQWKMLARQAAKIPQ